MIQIYDLVLGKERAVSLEEFEKDIYGDRSFVPTKKTNVTLSKDDGLINSSGSDIYEKIKQGFTIFNPRTPDPDIPNDDGTNLTITGDKDDDEIRALESKNLSSFGRGFVSSATLGLDSLVRSEEGRQRRKDLKEANPFAYGAGAVAGFVPGIAPGLAIKGTGLIAKGLVKGAGKLAPKQFAKVQKGISAFTRGKIGTKAAVPVKKAAKATTKFLDYAPVAALGKLSAKGGSLATKGLKAAKINKNVAAFTGARVGEGIFGGAYYGIQTATQAWLSERSDGAVGENGLISALSAIAADARKGAVYSAAIGGTLGLAGRGLQFVGKPVGNFFKEFVANQSLGLGNAKQKIEFAKEAVVPIKEFFESVGEKVKVEILAGAGVGAKKSIEKWTNEEVAKVAVGILANRGSGILKNVSVKDNKLSIFKKLEAVTANHGKALESIYKSVKGKKTNLTGNDVINQLRSKSPISKTKAQLSKFGKVKQEIDEYANEVVNFVATRFQSSRGGWAYKKLSEVLDDNALISVIKINAPKFKEFAKNYTYKGRPLTTETFKKMLKENPSLRSEIFNLKSEFSGFVSIDNKALVTHLLKKYNLNVRDLGALIDNFKEKAKFAGAGEVKKEGLEQALQRVVGSLTGLRKNALQRLLTPKRYKEFLKKNSSYGLVEKIKKNIPKDSLKSQSPFALRDMFNVTTFGLGAVVFKTFGAGGGAGLLGAGFLANSMMQKGTGMLAASKAFQGFSSKIEKTARLFRELSDPTWLGLKRRINLRSAAYSTLPYNALSQGFFGSSSEDIDDFATTINNHIQEAPKDPVEIATAKELIYDAAEDSSLKIASLDIAKMRVIKQLKETYDTNMKILGDIPNIKGKYVNIERKIKAFERDIAVIFDPEALMDNISSGFLTPQMIQNFKVVFPNKYEEMQYNFFIAYKEGKLENLTRRQLRTVSRFIGYDLTGIQGIAIEDGDQPFDKVGGYEGSLRQKEAQQSPVQRIEKL